MLSRRTLIVVLANLVLIAGCGAGATAGGDASTTGGDGASDTTAAARATETAPEAVDQQRYPDILAVEIARAGDGVFDLAVTVSSPYDTAERYADGWRVLAPDGTELGTRTLMHDHANEQPFTRTHAGVEIPSDVAEVTVEGRDQRYGFGGGAVTVEVPHGGG